MASKIKMIVKKYSIKFHKFFIKKMVQSCGLVPNKLEVPKLC